MNWSELLECVLELGNSVTLVVSGDAASIPRLLSITSRTLRILSSPVILEEGFISELAQANFKTGIITLGEANRVDDKDEKQKLIRLSKEKFYDALGKETNPIRKAYICYYISICWLLLGSVDMSRTWLIKSKKECSLAEDDVNREIIKMEDPDNVHLVGHFMKPYIALGAFLVNPFLGIGTGLFFGNQLRKWFVNYDIAGNKKEDISEFSEVVAKSLECLKTNRKGLSEGRSA